jgi:hypothetical protein
MVGRTLDWKGELGRWLKPLSSLPQSDQMYLCNHFRSLFAQGQQTSTREDITMLLTSNSYCLFDGDKSLNKAKRIDRATWNIIAIPEERKERRLDFC